MVTGSRLRLRRRPGDSRLTAWGDKRIMHRARRRMAIAASCLLALAGCTTQLGDVDATGAILEDGAEGLAPAQTLSATRDGLKDLQLGKRHYRERNFGLAEQHYRRAVEAAPQDLEAWVGLAATYDQLGRFDLADRAYEQAIILAGPTAEILNNQGYSLMLRGDYDAAREKLEKAKALDPDNRYINANLELLAEG